MEDLATFYDVLLAICGGLIAIWGAVKIIKEIYRPSAKMREDIKDLNLRVQTLENDMGMLEQKMKKYTKNEIEDVRQSIDHHLVQFDRLNNCIEGVLESLLAIGDHLISGNDVNKIKKANEKIIGTLIHHDREL